MYNVICNNIWPLKTIILNTLDSYVDRFRYSSIFSVYRSIPDVSNMRTSDTWQWKHENQECQSHLSRKKKKSKCCKENLGQLLKRTFSPPFSGFPRSQITLSSKLHCTSWSWTHGQSKFSNSNPKTKDQSMYYQRFAVQLLDKDKAMKFK